MFTRQQFLGWIALAIAGCLLAACGGLAGEPVIVATMPPQPTSAPQTISLPETAPDVALGAQVYAQNCTRCHGLTGKGDGEMVQSGQVSGVPNFTDPQVSQAAAPADWFETVTNGRLEKLMPPWKDKLTDTQRWAVTLYVYTLPVSTEQIAQGQNVWNSQCAECHGSAGEGTAKGAPLPNLLQRTQVELFKTLAGGIPDKMPSFAGKLSPADQSAVLAYARTLGLTGTGSVPQEAVSVPTSASGEVPPPMATAELEAAAPASTAEPNAVAAATTGSVSGKVVNKTAGASVPADLKVNLHVVGAQNAQSPGEIRPVTIAADGSYRFDNVPIQTGQQYMVTASYNGTAFSSEVVDGDPAHPQLDLPLSIYEVGDDPAQIQIDGILTMTRATAQSGVLQIVQIVSFVNKSDRVFAKQDGGTQSSVSVRLPVGAVFQDLSGGDNLISSDGTQVLDRQPLLPGDSRVMHLGFSVPYPGSASIDQPVDFRLDGPVEVMVESSAMSVTGDGFSSLGARQLGDRTYTGFGGNLTREAGQSLRFSISGSAVAAQQTGLGTATSLNTLAYILIGAGLLAIGAALGFFLRERTPRTPSPVVPAPSNAEINGLIRQIADLDVQYKSGTLAESRYSRQRAALKARLTTLMKERAAASEAETPDREE